MKNINPYVLPHFHGLTGEDDNMFLFEFEVLYRTYDYKIDAQKLRLLPSTLKEAVLRWFISLDGNSISTWDQMKQAFIKKYRPPQNPRH
jgi:hypothetical protein